jgi:hypothetical protein
MCIILYGNVIAYYKALLRFLLGNVFSCFFKNKKIMDFDDGVIMCFPRVRKIIRSHPDDVQIAICCFTINNERENQMAASSLTSQSIKDKRKNSWLRLHYHHTDHEGEKKKIIDSKLG